MARVKLIRKPVTKTAPKRVRISPEAMSRARRRMGNGRDRGPRIHPFVIATHPPGVVPKDHSTMANDAALDESLKWAKMAFDEAISVDPAWANNAMFSTFAEGQQFLGYSYLAILAQRPEYRRISEVIATEMTRKWIRFESAGEDDGDDKSDKIKQINAEFKRLKVRERFREAAAQDGFFGRSHIYIDTGDTDNPDELKLPIGNGVNKISKRKVGPKKPILRLQCVEAVWSYPTQYNTSDPLKADWYKPTSWFAMGKEIHASRYLTFIGREVPDILKPAYSFGGLSLSQMAKPYVDNWLRTRQSVSDLIHSFSVFVLETDLMTSLQSDGQALFDRLDMFNLIRDNRGIMALNKDTEQFSNVSTSLSTLDQLQAQSQEHICSVTGLPLVKYTGLSPHGLNASSEGELRSFYDWIAAYQEALFSENLDRILALVQLSLFGEVDPEIGYAYEPLWELDEVQRATVEKTKADTDAVYIQEGVLNPIESRKRLANAAESPYASLDVDDLPEPPSDPSQEEDPFGNSGESDKDDLREASESDKPEE